MFPPQKKKKEIQVFFLSACALLSKHLTEAKMNTFQLNVCNTCLLHMFSITTTRTNW